jgi:hypothetical protein
VIAFGITCAPEFMQITRKASRGAHDYITRAGNLVYDSNRFSLSNWLTTIELVYAIDFFVSLLAE